MGYRWNFIKCNCADDEESVLQALSRKLQRLQKEKCLLKVWTHGAVDHPQGIIFRCSSNTCFDLLSTAITGSVISSFIKNHPTNINQLKQHSNAKSFGSIKMLIIMWLCCLFGIRTFVIFHLISQKHEDQNIFQHHCYVGFKILWLDLYTVNCILGERKKSSSPFIPCVPFSTVAFDCHKQNIFISVIEAHLN